MAEQWWSWALTLVGVACFFLAGKKVWWAWYVGLGGQLLWLAYALISGQLGFLVGVFLYTFVYSKNAWEWTREHFYPLPDSYRTRAFPPGTHIDSLEYNCSHETCPGYPKGKRAVVTADGVYHVICLTR